MPDRAASSLLDYAEIDWGTDGVPRSRLFGDVYFSLQDGLAETRAVFHGGCHLPDAWQGRNDFTIAEFGFGTGLNFLATWQLFDRTRTEGQTLHYISTEGYPLTPDDAARALACWPELEPYAAQLLAQWLDNARGVKQMDFGTVKLTIYADDIRSTLPRLDIKADAWFLDGFAPAKNPDMWGDIYAHIARCSHTGTRAATYSVAGHVRRGLESAGFTVEKVQGFGRKKERLEAVML